MRLKIYFVLDISGECVKQLPNAKSIIARIKKSIANAKVDPPVPEYVGL